MTSSPIANSFLVFLGAGIGGNLRYWVGGWAASRYGAVFPWGTLVVNVFGSLVIGLFMQLYFRHEWPAGWRLFFAIGVLGGFTTFSTFSYETLKLFEERSYLFAAGNAVLSVVASLAACWLGMVAGKLIGG